MIVGTFATGQAPDLVVTVNQPVGTFATGQQHSDVRKVSASSGKRRRKQ